MEECDSRYTKSAEISTRTISVNSNIPKTKPNYVFSFIAERQPDQFCKYRQYDRKN